MTKDKDWHAFRDEQCGLSYCVYKDHAVVYSYTGFVSQIRLLNEIDGVPVTEIESYAFNDFSKLQEIFIPGNISIIPPDAFGQYTSPLRLQLEENHPYFTQKGNALFTKDEKTLLFYLGAKKQYPQTEHQYDVPEGVTTIRDRAFAECDTLYRIHLPESLTTIGSEAFLNCSSLGSIHLPESVTRIEEGAFINCRRLMEVHLPKKVTQLAEGLFTGCQRLPEITLHEGVTTIGSGAFDQCHSLKKIHLPNTIKRIAKFAFSYCYSLENVTLPEGVKTVGLGAFCYCRSLKRVNIPKKLRGLGDSVFANCPLVQIQLPEDHPRFVQTENALLSRNGKRLICYLDRKDEQNQYAQKYAIPDGVDKIGEFMFNDCKKLKEVHIPNSVRRIELSAFSHCPSLEKVNIPDRVNYLDSYSFSECRSLHKIVIPKSVKTIKDDAFSDCKNLVIYGFRGSTAEKYAEKESIPFQTLDDN